MQKIIGKLAFLALLISSVAVFSCPNAGNTTVQCCTKEKTPAEEAGIIPWHFSSTGFML